MRVIDNKKRNVLYLAIFLAGISFGYFSSPKIETGSSQISNNSQLSDSNQDGMTNAPEAHYFLQGLEATIISSEYTKNGEISQQTILYADGSSGLIKYTDHEERDYRNTLYPRSHSYWEYKKDKLIELAERNDGAAYFHIRL